MAFPFTSYDALIADGAIRSGKTVFMTLAYIDWAMRDFDGQSFAICGKTVDSSLKNVLEPYMSLRYAINKYSLQWHRAKKTLTVTGGGRQNKFEIFGGKDESSYKLIQGRTFAGVLFDEVALQPKSFVEQALARCSVEGSKFWFNCNPDSPRHWFYEEWVCQLEKHNAYRLHFQLEDNPSLSPKMIARYKSLYTGVFYRRYIEGEWVQADGIVYPMYNPEKHVVKTKPRAYSKYYVSCDYGILNPMSIGIWGFYGGRWYRAAESYFDARKEGHCKTDEEHYDELVRLIAETIPDKNKLQSIIVDPSASSFIECIKRHGRYRVKQADNDVLSGIANVSVELEQGRLLFNDCCRDIAKEFGAYVWDEKSGEHGEERPVKSNDHAMDDMRYFVQTVLYKRKGMRIG